MCHFHHNNYHRRWQRTRTTPLRTKTTKTTKTASRSPAGRSTPHSKASTSASLGTGDAQSATTPTSSATAHSRRELRPTKQRTSDCPTYLTTYFHATFHIQNLDFCELIFSSLPFSSLPSSSLPFSGLLWTTETK